MAGRTQLAVSGEGSRDAYLIDDPEYTPFREVFHKRTAYATQTVNLEHLGEGMPDFGQTLRFKIASNIGDLLTNLAFRMTLPRTGRSATGWVESIGHAIIERVDLIMGDVVIQRLTSDELTIHSEHHVTQTKQNALSQLIGKYPIRSAGTRVGSKSILYYLGSQATTESKWIVDLPFWFYMKEHLAVPLCALYKQEVFVEVKLRDYAPLVVSYQNISSDPDVDNATRPTLSTTPHLVNFTMDAEVVFVDEFERTKIQHSAVDYVIHQYQRQEFTVAAGVTTARLRTSFNNPVKELLCDPARGFGSGITILFTLGFRQHHDRRRDWVWEIQRRGWTDSVRTPQEHEFDVRRHARVGHGDRERALPQGGHGWDPSQQDPTDSTFLQLLVGARTREGRAVGGDQHVLRQRPIGGSRASPEPRLLETRSSHRGVRERVANQ